MRPSVEIVTRVARAVLLLAAAGCGYRLLPPDAAWLGGVAWNGWSHLVLGYGLTALAFAAFPHARRGDLLKIVVLVAAVLEVARRFAGCACGPWDFIADAAGASAIWAALYIERFRAAGRGSPSSRFTLSLANDRRTLAPESEESKLFAAAAPRGGG